MPPTTDTPTKGLTAQEIKTTPMFRSSFENGGLKLEGERQIDVDKRTVTLSVSSEFPVQRFFGAEILDHTEKSVRLDRMRDGAPALWVHNQWGKQIGVVESVEIRDRKMHLEIRFSRNDEASQVFNDVLDKIIRNVSIGYRVFDMVPESFNEDTGAVESFRVIDWEPFEVSFVTVPADPTVGVDREMEDETVLTRQMLPSVQEKRKEPTMDPVVTPVEDPKVPATVKATDTDLRDANTEGAKRGTSSERERVKEIQNTAKRFESKSPKIAELAEQFIDSDRSANDFNVVVLAEIAEAGEAIQTGSRLEMPDKDVRRFSIVRALNALATGDKRAMKDAGFELEVSRAAQELRGDRSDDYDRGGERCFTVPTDILTGGRSFMAGDNGLDPEMYQRLIRSFMSHDKQIQHQSAYRDLVVGTPSAGGDLVATDLLAGDFIDLLRNVALLIRLGATELRDLTGDIAIPRMTSAATAAFVAENAATSESAPAFDQVTLSPETVTAFVDMSRRLLIQSSIDVENLVRMDLLIIVALAIDLAGITGDGTGNNPTGILNQAGIGDVALGTNGAAPTRNSLISLWREIATDNALTGNISWLTNAQMVSRLAKTLVDAGSGQFIINELPGDDGMFPMLGIRGGMSQQVPADLTKGTNNDNSAIILANMRDLIIGLWGGIDIIVDPFSLSTQGATRMVIHQDVNIAVRHPESFAAIQDARDI